ncbi:hypothetical protein C8R42DRAFT_126201 [Lentinula raphanica]|nr:hypothetical protein C8R42DRAFT_126201 [Lentinula raphanica]
MNLVLLKSIIQRIDRRWPGFKITIMATNTFTGIHPLRSHEKLVMLSADYSSKVLLIAQLVPLCLTQYFACQIKILGKVTGTRPTVCHCVVAINFKAIAQVTLPSFSHWKPVRYYRQIKTSPSSPFSPQSWSPTVTINYYNKQFKHLCTLYAQLSTMVYTHSMFTTLLAFGAASFVVVVSAIPIDTNSGPSLTSSAATSTPTSNSHTPTSTSPSQLFAATPSSHDTAGVQSNDQVYTFVNDRHSSLQSKQANPVLQPENPQRLAPSVPKGTVPSVYDMVRTNSAALSRVIWPGLRGTGQGPSKPDINKMPSHVKWPGMPNIRQGMPSDVRVSGMDISHDMGLRPSDVRVSGKDISDDMVRRPSDVLWPVVNIHNPGGTMDPNSEETVPNHASGGALHLV